MQAERERRFDDYEVMAVQAMFNRQAYHAKKLKQADLFKRPDGDAKKEQKSVTDMRKEVDEINDWLSKLTVEKG